MTQSVHWININLMSSLALHWVIPKLADFQQSHPEIKVNLSTRAEPLFTSLNKREIDIIIACQTTSISNETYHCVRLWDDSLVLVASPKLIKNHDQALNLRSLVQHFPSIYVDASLRKKDW